MSDNVNHPSHYTQAGVMLEPIDVIRDCPFDLGNAIKYVCRAGHKDDELQDLLKAKRYITWTAESYVFDPEPYEHFMKNNGLLMRKLTPFANFYSFTVKGLIAELEQLIDSRIFALANEKLVK